MTLLFPSALPVSLRTLPTEIDPKGICGTCRFFIDDPAEIDAEMRFLSGSKGVDLRTSERLADSQGRHRFGEEVARTQTHYNDDPKSGHVAMFVALADRLHVDPTSFGLCERVVDGAALVHKDCGKEADDAGQRINQCPVWQPMSKPQMLFGRMTGRSKKKWRERMAQARLLHAKPSLVRQECPWHPGREFRTCCGRRR